MKTLLCVCAALMMALTPITARAATDVSGHGPASSVAPMRQWLPDHIHLQQDGDKLTGTVQGAQGDLIAISDGKVDGDKFLQSLLQWHDDHA